VRQLEPHEVILEGDLYSLSSRLDYCEVDGSIGLTVEEAKKVWNRMMWFRNEPASIQDGF
jgi:hypothetical protein